MTIKQKFVISTALCISILFIIGLTIIYGYHHVTNKVSLVSSLDKQSMYLQMMLRGLNEAIINEGTPSTLRTDKEGIKGFEEVHLQLMENTDDPHIRNILINKIDPEWQSIKSNIRPFLQHYVDLNDEELMIEAGKLIIQTDKLIEQVNYLSEITRDVVDETSRKSGIVQIIMIIIFIGIILFSTILAYHLHHSITNPIKELTSIAEGFNRGDLSIMMDESRGDEFGSLARYFNKSTLRLNQTTRKLQEEITERKSAEEAVSHMAYHDNLTGLPNRYLFNDRLNMHISHTRRHKNKAAVLFIDIDDFKRINDTLGHSGGDRLLKAVADKLKNCIRTTDTVSRLESDNEETFTVARLGGDEFTMLLTHMRDSQEAVIVGKRLMEALSDPFEVGEYKIFMSISMGIAICPDDGEDAENLLKNADAAMYHAKKQGKNNFQFYRESMNAVYRKRLTVENELRRAIEQDELILHYQPRIDLRTGKISAMEALVRWQKPDKGLISPGEFIPVAEETGLIIPMGEWILRSACSQFKAWQTSGHLSDCVSVNISGRQFQRDNFITTISNVLKESSLDPRHLELEITESVLMQNAENTINMLYELKNMGIRLSMDDFGTGYSSFSYLKRFPLDVIKIDKSFIDDIPEKSETETIVAAIISMVHHLNLKIVAEGVESGQQLAFLRDNECDEFQGYLFSRPLPAEEFTELLEKSMNHSSEPEQSKDSSLPDSFLEI